MAFRLVILGSILIALTATFLQVWESDGSPDLVAYIKQQLLASTGSLEEALATLAPPEIITPPPLRGSFDQPGHTLTVAGILRETNGHRATNDQAPLILNETLNKAAQNKVADMFAQQYFEHVSPDGRGSAAVVEAVNYDYLRVGENLALGNYDSDLALVEAWMNSPGHRANILADGFTEIGIAVASGTFEGHTTWLAVQTFGLPASTCPSPEEKLQDSFEAKKQAAITLYTELQNASSLDYLKEKSQTISQLFDQGNDKIKAGNEEIEQGNQIYQETGDQSAAQPHWDRGAALHKEGQAIIDQATKLQADFKSEQAAYNNKVSEANQLNEAASALAQQLNQQIAAYNTCAARFNNDDH